MANRIIAIGDIHGCERALATLLTELAPDAEDVVIPLGDVVDRGPHSRQVLDLLLEWRQRCELLPILGNHEEMMLSVLSGRQPPHEWLQHGGVATLDSYGFTGDLDVVPLEHTEFISGFLPLVETDAHFFVHAAYAPELPLSEQPPLALRWQTLRAGLPGPHRSGKSAVVGHTANVDGEVLDVGYLKCIDTYCYGGKWLTALDVATGVVVQANDLGELRGAAT